MSKTAEQSFHKSVSKLIKKIRTVNRGSKMGKHTYRMGSAVEILIY